MKKIMLLLFIVLMFIGCAHVDDGDITVYQVEPSTPQNFKYLVYIKTGNVVNIGFRTNERFAPGDKLKLVKIENLKKGKENGNY